MNVIDSKGALPFCLEDQNVLSFLILFYTNFESSDI